MRQNGFSLMEVGIAVSIVAMLAGVTLGAANVVRESSTAEELRNMARGLQMSVESFRGLHGYSPRYSGDESGTFHPGWWFSVHENTQTNNPPVYGSGPNQFTNPYTGATQSAWQVRNSASAGYPVGSVTGVTYNSAAYPLTSVGGTHLKGRLLYFPKGDGSSAQRIWGSIKVWNGVADVYFRDYAIQAIDSKGYPVCTIGL